jgi:hypothetical protein
MREREREREQILCQIKRFKLEISQKFGCPAVFIKIQLISNKFSFKNTIKLIAVKIQVAFPGQPTEKAGAGRRRLRPAAQQRAKSRVDVNRPGGYNK